MERHNFNNLVTKIGDSFNIVRAEKGEPSIYGIGLERFTVAAFRPGYSFLKCGLKDSHLLRSDHTLLPEVHLYSRKGTFFMSRGICSDLTSDVFASQLNQLENVTFQNCKFESILGYLIDSNKNDYDLMIHSYTTGIELSSISCRAPTELCRTMSMVTAHSFAELHTSNIIYAEMLPTNIRYGFNFKLLLNPHQFIEFDSDSREGKLQDLSLFILTNSWLPDKAAFLREYGTKMKYSKKQKMLLEEEVTSYLEIMVSDPDLGYGAIAFL